MGLVSFNSLHTNDLDKHTINWYTHNTDGKVMKRNDDYLVLMGVILLIGLAIWTIYG